MKVYPLTFTVPPYWLNVPSLLELLRPTWSSEALRVPPPMV